MSSKYVKITFNYSKTTSNYSKITSNYSKITPKDTDKTSNDETVTSQDEAYEAGVATLHWACKGCHVDITCYLIDTCSIPVDICDDNGLTPLMFAAALGHTDIVKSLLQRTVDVRKTDKTGKTALHYAVIHNHVKITDLLITNNARLDAMDISSGATPLYYAAMNGHLAIARTLIEHNCELDVQNSEGDTPLHVACREEWDEVALLMLRNGASTTLRNKSNMTPIYVASNYLRRLLKNNMKLIQDGKELE